MKKNKDYVRKRKPIDVKIADLNGSDSDEDKEFMVKAEVDLSNISKRTMPRRKCKKNVTMAPENEAFSENLSYK